jgi:hypothetical protein
MLLPDFSALEFMFHDEHITPQANTRLGTK